MASEPSICWYILRKLVEHCLMAAEDYSRLEYSIRRGSSAAQEVFGFMPNYTKGRF